MFTYNALSLYFCILLGPVLVISVHTIILHITTKEMAGKWRAHGNMVAGSLRYRLVCTADDITQNYLVL
jgi:hypothetical protein